MISRSTRSILRIKPSLRPTISIPPGALAAPLTSHSLTVQRDFAPLSRSPLSSTVPRSRGYSSLNSSSGKSDGDLLVDELQELYEVAKDEFEIATDSTDGATIYAASDRESARDALNQLVAVYSLYTSDVVPSESESQGQEEGEGPLITTNYEPSEIKPEVKEEVKKRVGQRVREIRNAVELLEERAKTD